MKALAISTALIAITALLFGGAANTLAAQHAARHSTSVAALTMKITDTGTVWGTVTLVYRHAGATVHKSCNAAICRLSIPKGARVRISQTPTNSTTWPFQKWIVRVGNASKISTATSVTVAVSRPMTISAVYVLASSGGGYHYP